MAIKEDLEMAISVEKFDRAASLRDEMALTSPLMRLEVELSYRLRTQADVLEQIASIKALSGLCPSFESQRLIAQALHHETLAVRPLLWQCT